jgi:putative tryptophan/tyrosine transport system substrate-binding protein
MWAARAALAVAVACSLFTVASPATAQPASRPPLVGFLPLGSESNAFDRSLVEAFRKGLSEAGFVEGRDVVLEVVWTTSEEAVPQAVLGFVRRGAKVLVPVGTTASMAVKRHAPTTPILFISVGNPLGIGLVESLSRPGLNVTGFSDSLAELSAKYVQFATELGNSPGVVHYLWYPGWTDGHYRFQATEKAAQSLKIKLRPHVINDIAQVDPVMVAMKKAGASVVVVQPSPFTFRERERLVASATSHGLATIFAFRPAATAGALITYGPDYGDLYRRAASYLAKILRGTKPGDLPVEQPTKFEFVVNLKTAKAIGITIPPSLLLRADQVID